MTKEVFADFILRVLCVACLVSTTLGIIKDGWAHGFQEGAGIFIAIIIIWWVSVGNDYVKEKQFQELMQRSDIKEVEVKRAGILNNWDSEALVVGDIVMIHTGDTIPADCIVINCSEFSCSEAALTGEPDAMPKEPVSDANIDFNPDPFILQSSLCEKGTATALVLAVGNNTNQGKAGLSMNIENDQTPLQKKLDSIAEGIGKLGMAVAILTFIAIVISTLIITFKDDDKEFDMSFVTAVCNGLVIAITVVVVAVPEGLPLAVTISLAYSVGKMFEENNLVRKLASSETMGNANEICSDKTGTLTQNKMTVMSLYAEDRVMDGEANDSFMQMASHDDIMRAVVFNSTAKIAPNRETGKEETTGNATEVGMIKYLTASGAPTREMIADRTDRGEPVAKVDFSSERKRSTTCVYTKNDTNVRVYCKGAPEKVITKCEKMVGPNGAIVDLDDDKKDQIVRDIIDVFASKCLRTILVAYADIPRDEFERTKAGANDFKTNDDKEILEQDLIFGAVFGIKDPLRDGIKEAVAKCHHAGINVRMVTGDIGTTAKAISLEAGIITEADIADGEEN